MDHPLLQLVSVMEHTVGQRQFPDPEKYREILVKLFHVPAEEVDAAIDALAQRTAAIAPELLAQSKRIINESIELKGRPALQTFAVKANAAARREILVSEEERSND